MRVKIALNSSSEHFWWYHLSTSTIYSWDSMLVTCLSCGWAKKTIHQNFDVGVGRVGRKYETSVKEQWPLQLENKSKAHNNEQVIDGWRIGWSLWPRSGVSSAISCWIWLAMALDPKCRPCLTRRDMSHSRCWQAKKELYFNTTHTIEAHKTKIYCIISSGMLRFECVLVRFEFGLRTEYLQRIRLIS